MLPSSLTEFLTDGADPSVRYFALRDLMDRPADDPERRAAGESIGKDGWAAGILADQQDGGYWGTFRGNGDELYLPKYVATNWRLLILSDLGLTKEDPRIDRAAQLLFQDLVGARGRVRGARQRAVRHGQHRPDADPIRVR